MERALKDSGSLKGSYVIRVTDSRTGELLRTIKCANLIVNGAGYGYDIISRQLGGSETYPIAIDSAAVGTGTNPASSSDTALQTPVVSGIEVADVEFTAAGVVKISFFLTDGLLANGTYHEFGIFADGRLFARSIISPALVKGSNQNITVEYTLDFS